MGSEKPQQGAMPAAAPSVIVISASLNPNSRSHRLAESAAGTLTRLGADVDPVDLRQWDLPLCDGGESYSHPAVEKINQRIQNAKAILLAAPIYNYDMNAAAKNLVELTGDAWEDKPVGFLCSAGGKSAYMSPIGLANSLMFDFRCWIIPRFVYATRGEFNEDGSPSQPIANRIEQLAKAALEMARALEWMRGQQSTLGGSS